MHAKREDGRQNPAFRFSPRPPLRERPPFASGPACPDPGGSAPPQPRTETIRVCFAARTARAAPAARLCRNGAMLPARLAVPLRCAALHLAAPPAAPRPGLRGSSHRRAARPAAPNADAKTPAAARAFCWHGRAERSCTHGTGPVPGARCYELCARCRPGAQRGHPGMELLGRSPVLFFNVARLPVTKIIQQQKRFLVNFVFIIFFWDKLDLLNPQVYTYIYLYIAFSIGKTHISKEERHF